VGRHQLASPRSECSQAAAEDLHGDFSGPKSEAVQIKQQLGQFLQDELKLKLSESKTLITHARTGRARFLGYDIVTWHCDDKLDSRGRRTTNANIGLLVTVVPRS
jgi:hypothetical protein